MTTRHLDLGCGPCPRNPYHHDETHAVDLTLPPGMDMGLVRGLATAVALIAFLAVVAWAYGRQPRSAFREAEQLPLEEDESPESRA